MKSYSLKIIGLICLFAIITQQNLYAQQVLSNSSQYAKEKRGILEGRLFNYSVNIGLNYNQLTKYYENYTLESLANYVANANAAHSFQSEAFVFLKNKIGIGLGYEYYSKSLEYGIVDLGNQVFPNYVNYKHDVSFHTFTSTLVIKTPVIKNKYFLNVFGGIDFTNYVNPYKINSNNLELNGKNTGFHIGLANEISISRTLNAGLKIKYHQLSIEKVKLVEGSTETEYKLVGNDKINLNRISVGVYLGLK
jgi:hypothetical protein